MNIPVLVLLGFAAWTLLILAASVGVYGLRLAPQVKPETSRFPRKELPHMPGSSTTPG